MLLIFIYSAWGKEVSPPTIGTQAPDFTLSGVMNSEQTHLAALRGQVVVLDFWASWCGPCKKTMLGMKHLKSILPQANFLAISVDEERKNANGFVKQNGFEGLIPLHDALHQVAEHYALAGMPTAILLDKKGVIRYRHEGYTEREAQTLETEIRNLLEEK